MAQDSASTERRQTGVRSRRCFRLEHAYVCVFRSIISLCNSLLGNLVAGRRGVLIREGGPLQPEKRWSPAGRTHRGPNDFLMFSGLMLACVCAVLQVQ